MNDPLTLKDAPLSTAGVQFHLSHHKNLFTPETADGAHIHNYYEIYLNVSGDVSFLVNNRLYPVGPGDAILSRPGDVHVCIGNGECIHDHYCLWITAEEGSPLLSVFDRDRHFFAGAGTTGGTDTLFRLFSQLEEAIAEEAAVAKTACLLQILHTLESDAAPAVAETPHLPEEMQKILDYFNAHFAEIGNVSDVTEPLHVSYATLNRRFRQYIRLSPREFLEAKKLSYAKSLLRQGVSVTEACLQSGFSDCSYFISVFKKKFGETPLRYTRHP